MTVGSTSGDTCQIGVLVSRRSNPEGLVRSQHKTIHRDLVRLNTLPAAVRKLAMKIPVLSQGTFREQVVVLFGQGREAKRPIMGLW